VDKLISLLIGAGVMVIFGAMVMFYLESGHPDSEIDSWLDAIWWAAATVTTVGYGDLVPVTDAGRIIAIFYMFFGVTVLGISLSVLATRYYKQKFEDSKQINHGQKLILEKINDLEKNQEKLQSDLRDLIEKLKNKINNNDETQLDFDKK